MVSFLIFALIMMTILYISFLGIYHLKPAEIEEKPSALLQGFSLRRDDFYLQISLEKVIEQAILYKMRPQDVKIWAHYTDGRKSQIEDLSEFVHLRPLTVEEEKEIDAVIEREFSKEKVASEQVGEKYPIFGYNGLGICSGVVMFRTGEAPHYSTDYVQHLKYQRRRELIREKALEWKKENNFKSSFSSEFGVCERKVEEKVENPLTNV